MSHHKPSRMSSGKSSRSIQRTGSKKRDDAHKDARNDKFSLTNIVADPYWSFRFARLYGG